MIFVLIVLKRIYDEIEPDDGKRILVDRLWPRGVKKDAAKIDDWIKEIAPSDDLRKWYGHNPAKWNQFKEKYWKELENQQEPLSKLAKDCREGKVALLYSTKKRQYNNAAALKEYLETKLKLC